MKIKKILNLTEVSKESLKKRIIQVGAVSLGVFLVLGSKGFEKYKEIQYKIEQQKLEEENAEKNISLSSCRVLIENFPDGTVKHHFVDKENLDDFQEKENYKEFTYEIQALTDKNFKIFHSRVSYYDTNKYLWTCDEIPETNGKYIYDYNVPYYMFDAEYLSLPNGYSFDALYSVNDLKELEEKLDASIYEKKEDNKSYDISNLILVEVNGEYMCFDFTNLPICVTETTDKTDATKVRYMYYIPSIGNDLVNLKISSGMTISEERLANINFFDIRDHFVIEGITGLDQTMQNDFSNSNLIIKNMEDYLNAKQQFYRNITKEELTKLLEHLNDPNYKKRIEVENYVAELAKNSSVNLCYLYHSPNHSFLGISVKDNYEGEKELSDDFYEKLNYIITEGGVDSIRFYNLDDHFDLTKIDYSNIDRKSLMFVNYTGTFDCTSLKDNLEISFTNTSVAIAKEILSTCDVTNIHISWKEEIEQQSDLKSFLEFLIENNVQIDSFVVEQRNKNEYEGITQAEFDLFSKVNANYIDIDADGFKNPIELDLTLNPQIQYFSIDAYKKYDCTNSELGTIKIESNNPDLNVSFRHTDITSNTHFSLPEDTCVNLLDSNCSNIEAFKNLKNVRTLKFGDYDILASDELNQRFVVYYKEEAPLLYPGARFYTDYDQMLKDLEYWYELANLRENLNVSPYENEEYCFTPSIGDFVNLASDNVPVYKNIESLENKENYVSSYYGTSILRCISAIDMTNGERNVEVGNMEDYEIYINAGYSVIGYQFVNLNSLNPDGTLTEELRCEEDHIKLVYTPFNR